MIESNEGLHWFSTVHINPNTAMKTETMLSITFHGNIQEEVEQFNKREAKTPHKKLLILHIY